MAKKHEKLAPTLEAPAPLVAGPDEVVILIGDPNHENLRERVIPKGNLGVTITIAKQSYHHVATDPAGRWIFVPF